MNSNPLITDAGVASSSDHRILRALARAGYLAKGIVYATVGLAAASAVFGWFGTGRVGGTRGALDTIASRPFGNVLLILLFIGLCGYVVWRFVQGLFDTEEKGSDISGWMQRTGFMISGTMYAALAYYATRLLGWLPLSSNSGSRGTTELTASLMQHAWGIILIGLFGAGFMGVGIYQAYRSTSKKFKDNWKTGRLTPKQEQFATRLAQFGIGVRAATFMIIGGLVVKAAIDVDPAKAKGLGQALKAIHDQPFGQTMLAVVAFGLIAYGIYCFINSRYRAMTIR